MNVSNVSIAILPVLVIFIVAICIPICIGIYVYRDANRRRMNAALWTLVAILAPALIGFIIYLLVRGNYSDLKCPQCNTSVKEEYVVCPKCGVKMRPSCPSCAATVESDWKVCPKCAQPLPEYYEDIVTPQPIKDNSLKRILLAVILIPTMLMLILFCYALFLANDYSMATSMEEVTLERLYSWEGTSELKEVLESLNDDSHKAYILRYDNNENNNDEYSYFVYLPMVGYEAAYSMESVTGFFCEILRLDFNDGDTRTKSVYDITVTTSAKHKFEIYYQGEKLDYEIIDVNYDSPNY